MKSGVLAVALILFSAPALGQIKWYKFDKRFIEQHYQQDGSAFGVLKASAVHPAQNVHPIDCGGNDGELHIGIAENSLGNGTTPISAFAQENDSQFGIVAEPPNVKRGTSFFTKVEATEGKPAFFFGYFRLWNEGHDVTPIFPSNPHHVLEVHPAWGIRSGDFIIKPRPAVIFAMPGFSGYGASKFVPVLQSVPRWLRVPPLRRKRRSSRPHHLRKESQSLKLHSKLRFENHCQSRMPNHPHRERQKPQCLIISQTEHLRELPQYA